MQVGVSCYQATSKTTAKVFRMTKSACFRYPQSHWARKELTPYTWEVPLHGLDVNSLVSNLPLLRSHDMPCLYRHTPQKVVPYISGIWAVLTSEELGTRMNMLPKLYTHSRHHTISCRHHVSNPLWLAKNNHQHSHQTMGS